MRLLINSIDKDENFVVDYLTKYKCLNDSIVLYNKTFDKRVLIDFLTLKKDLRNPITNEPWDKKEMEVILHIMDDTEKNLLNTTSEEIKLPQNVKTSIKQFLEEQSTYCVIGLVNLTETFIENAEMLQDLDKQYYLYMNKLKMYICGLLYYDPLFCASVCVKLIEKLKLNAEGKFLISIINTAVEFLNIPITAMMYSSCNTNETLNAMNLYNIKIELSRFRI